MYDIKISEAGVSKCTDFAKQTVDSTYDRFHVSYEDRVKRIKIGKVGELSFLHFLNDWGANLSEDELFVIHTHGDAYDFKTTDGRTIDVKTPHENYHTRILVPYDQFENGKCKDLYVGVFANLATMTATIHGYCAKDILKANGKEHFGEGLAYWEKLNMLKEISSLMPHLGCKGQPVVKQRMQQRLWQ